MTLPSLIFALAIVTLVGGVAAGLYQLRRVRQAKRQGTTSALSSDR